MGQNTTRDPDFTEHTKLSFIIPAYNEGENLNAFTQQLLTKTQALPYHIEILFINDGSHDDTLSQMKGWAENNNHIKIISFSRNFGKELAISAGLQHCSGDAAIIIDADLQHPLDIIDSFLDQWKDGYNMVYATCTDRKNKSLLKRFFSSVFYRLLNRLSATTIPPNAGDFRLLDRKVINAINQCGEYDRFMKGLYAWVGFESIGVSYTPAQRYKGRSHFPMSGLFSLAITGIISFSEIPLRIWGVFGFIISIISFIYGIFVTFDTLFFGVDLPGFATLIISIMFLGGIQLMSIGILGEYIGRIFREVKKRPKYIIAHQQGFDIEQRMDEDHVK